MGERKLWLQAEENFRNDIKALVTCLSCKKGNLFATDIPFDENNIAKGGERCMMYQLRKI